MTKPAQDRLPIRLLEHPGFLARLFGTRPNAFTEIWQLVATTPIATIPRATVAEILDRYHVDADESKRALLTLYGAILLEACRDDQLTDAQVRGLHQLRSLFGLSSADVAELTSAAHRERLGAVLENAGHSERQDARMGQLSERLRLPADVAAAAPAPERSAHIERVVKGIAAHHHSSPAEAVHLRALADQLAATITYDVATQASLERYRLLWRIDQGKLPQLAVPVNLRDGECCHFSTEATHLEFRTVTRALCYHGPSARIRIAKGVNWRVGAVAPTRVNDRELAPLDSGTLYLTNRRLLFHGARKSTTIRLSRIIDFTPYQDGIVIEKETGKDQFFRFTGEVELAAAILGALIMRDG